MTASSSSGFDDLARGTDSLWHLERERARDVRRWIGVSQIEDLRPAALTKYEHVGMSGGREECRLRCRSGENGVERSRRSVDEDDRVREEDLE